jgi:hypothetical protein
MSGNRGGPAPMALEGQSFGPKETTNGGRGRVGLHLAIEILVAGAAPLLIGFSALFSNQPLVWLVLFGVAFITAVLGYSFARGDREVALGHLPLGLNESGFVLFPSLIAFFRNQRVNVSAADVRRINLMVPNGFEKARGIVLELQDGRHISLGIRPEVEMAGLEEALRAKWPARCQVESF